MSVVRNCIDIVGITPENQLPEHINGQLVESSETENLFIDSNVEIKDIYQIIIETNIKGTRVIKTPISKIIVIDGYKNFKIAYYDSSNNMGILEMNSPYNLFFDVENAETSIEETNLYIVDAYFELISKNIVYCNILYMLDVQYINNTKRLGKKENIGSLTDFHHIYDKKSKLMIKDDILKEMSMSEYNKIESKKEINTLSYKKDELIDIDAEYL